MSSSSWRWGGIFRSDKHGQCARVEAIEGEGEFERFRARTQACSLATVLLILIIVWSRCSTAGVEVSQFLQSHSYLSNQCRITTIILIRHTSTCNSSPGQEQEETGEVWEVYSAFEANAGKISRKSRRATRWRPHSVQSRYTNTVAECGDHTQFSLGILRVLRCCGVGYCRV